jgi:gluconokinase
MAVVLALDLGTTNAKAQRFDEAGQSVGKPVHHPAGIGPDGCGDVEEVAAVAEAVLDEALRDGVEVDAVAVSSAWHTLVGVDHARRATTELSTWLDDRAADEAAALRQAVDDATDVHQRVGAPIHPSFPSARILWVARHDPAVFAATQRWCSLPELLLSRWFGDEVGPSASIASGTGLYNQRSGSWDDELLTAVGLDATQLGQVDDEARTGLAPAYGSRWPALAGVPWYSPQGDGACAVFGSGCAVPGRAALTVGTSAAVRMLGDRDRRRTTLLPLALFGYLVETDTPVVGAARSNAGAALAWAAEMLGLAGIDAAEDATRGRAPGGHGLVVDPSLVTERSPSWPLQPSAGFAGVRRTTTRLDILQGFVEAVAFGVADAVDALEEWAGSQTLVLGGGASTSAAWRQLLADVIGRPLECSPVSDDSARGAAIVALDRMGIAMPPPPPSELVVEPDAKRSSAFADLRAARAGSRFAASLGS